MTPRDFQQRDRRAHRFRCLAAASAVTLVAGGLVRVGGSPAHAVGSCNGKTIRGGTGNDTFTAVEPDASSIETYRSIETLELRLGVFTIVGGGGSDAFLVSNVDSDAGYTSCPSAPECLDRISGGPGSDTISFQQTLGAARVDLARGRATWAKGGHARLAGVENVEGSRTRDVLRGNRARNHFDGNGGPDALYGGGGNDVLHGGKGRDVAYGGPGKDRCVAERRYSC